MLGACSSGTRERSELVDAPSDGRGGDVGEHIDAREDDVDAGVQDTGGDSRDASPEVGDVSVDAEPEDTDSEDGSDSEQSDASGCDCEAGQICSEGVCRTAPIGGCSLGEQPAAGGRCARGCENSLECPPSSECVAGLCVTGCQTTAECGASAQCRENLCTATCSDDEPCADGVCIAGFCEPSSCASECGVGGQCVGERCVNVDVRACVDDSECARSEQCTEGTCESVAGRGVGFVVLESGVERHRFGTDGRYELGFGGAVAPGDYDGDGDVDLAFARDVNAAGCVYWNEGGQLARASDECEDWTNGESLSSADLDGDGRDELLIGGVGEIMVFAPETRSPLAALATIDQRTGEPLFVASLLPIDVDADGEWELLAGTSGVLDSPEQPVARGSNFVVEVRTNPWSLTRRETLSGFEDRGNVNSFGVFDIEDDGLYEVVVINDSFSSDTLRNTIEQPGLLVSPPVPGSGTIWALAPVLPDEKAWGSFMGAVWTEWNGTEGLYLTDQTSNRYLTWGTSSVAEDRAEELGLLLDRVGPDERALFSWSAIAADLDLDGDEDLVVSNGSPEFNPASAERWHETSVLIQQRDGAAARFDGGFGFSSPVDRESDEVFQLASTRVALPLDLDSDGRLEIVTTQVFGAVEHYEEDVSRAARCAVMARARVVLAAGWGVDWSPGRGMRWRRSNNFGHTLASPGPTIIADRRAGVIRFPSGAVEPFDCDSGNAIIIEPLWISRTSGEPSFAIDESRLEEQRIVSIDAVIRSPEGLAASSNVVRDPQTSLWHVDGATQAHDIMLRINGRWVRRWWAASE